MQEPCSLAWVTQPTTTSSTSARATPVRSASWFRVWARSSWGWMPERAPLPALPRPRGVRTASMMYAVAMSSSSLSSLYRGSESHDLADGVAHHLGGATSDGQEALVAPVPRDPQLLEVAH